MKLGRRSHSNNGLITISRISLFLGFTSPVLT